MPEHPEPAWGKSVGLLVPNLEPSGPTGAGGAGGCKPALPSGIGHEIWRACEHVRERGPRPMAICTMLL